MWVDFLYGLLWVTTLSAVIYTFILARGIRRSSSVSIERLFVLTFIMLLGIAALFVFFNKQLKQSADGGAYQGVSKMEHHDFVQQVYPPLITAQNKLSHQVNQLHDLQKQIIKLRGKHPQQAERLQFAYNQWLAERKELSQLKLKLDRSVRNAWIQHKTQNKKAIASAFNRQAVDWEKIISDRLSQLSDSQLKVDNAMLDNIILQNRNMSRFKPDQQVDFVTSGAVFKSAFAPGTATALLEYFENTAPDTAAVFSKLSDEINIASQRGREVRNYALGNTDLKPTLDKVVTSWLQLENRSIYYRDQVLHAVQASYLAVLLGTNKRDNQLIRLGKTLADKMPKLHQSIKASRQSLEKSYKTGIR